MPLEFCTDIPAHDQFWELFQTTGWNENYQLSPDDLMRALRSSWYVLSAYDGVRLVGFGRLVSDGVLHAMIYELIVLPEYQGQGVGGEILEKLVEKCRETGVRDIQLFCAQGKRDFYEKRGFVARPGDGPGMQYVCQGG
ncbi:MAG: GNAT family N-acetyltransferase [Anaerolineales bacterium]|nr:GNAT family N-acetyltransferase [Anaerolineales bacterium]